MRITVLKNKKNLISSNKMNELTKCLSKTLWLPTLGKLKALWIHIYLYFLYFNMLLVTLLSFCFKVEVFKVSSLLFPEAEGLNNLKTSKIRIWRVSLKQLVRYYWISKVLTFNQTANLSKVVSASEKNILAHSYVKIPCYFIDIQMTTNSASIWGCDQSSSLLQRHITITYSTVSSYHLLVRKFYRGKTPKDRFLRNVLNVKAEYEVFEI